MMRGQDLGSCVGQLGALTVEIVTYVLPSTTILAT